MLKIACIGTHGVGKSTLCYELARFYKSLRKNVYLVHETIRFSRLPINEFMIEDTAIWAFTTQVAKEIEATTRGVDVLICDRSVYDTFIYADHFSLNQEKLNPFKEAAKNWLNTYDHFILLRPDKQFDLFDDGVRSLNKDFQLRIDERFSDLKPHLNQKILTEMKSCDVFLGDQQKWMDTLGSSQL